uniref:Lectoxin-Vind1 n=1 Tax=Varanus indicus TaxID=62043 RepID=E2E4I9_VARIN|nr:lectoxin-Vind1 [Varanus indicus]
MKGSFAYCSIIGFLVVSCCFAGAGASCCPMDWLPYRGYCYRLFNSKLNWLEAELSCQLEASGGHLASIHSNAETSELAKYILKYRSDNGNVWIGMRDFSKNRVWSWTDRTSTSYKPWNTGEPNNLENDEACVELWSPSRYGRWNDENCKSARAYLCKYLLQ